MATTNETKPDEEVITVSREEMQVIDDGNDEEDDEPQIHVRRVFIAPVGFPQPMPMMANLLSHIAMAAKLEQASKMNSNPKHVIIEEPVEPTDVSAMRVNDNVSANKQAISGGSTSKTTFTFKPMKPAKSKHNTTKSTTKPTKSKANSAPETKSTEQPKSQNQSSSSSSVDASELIQNALSRCYTLLTALVALIMLVSFAVYRLYQEVVTYRNIKTSFIA